MLGFAQNTTEQTAAGVVIVVAGLFQRLGRMACLHATGLHSICAVCTYKGPTGTWVKICNGCASSLRHPVAEWLGTIPHPHTCLEEAHVARWLSALPAASPLDELDGET